jgi:hypothetical protein
MINTNKSINHEYKDRALFFPKKMEPTQQKCCQIVEAFSLKQCTLLKKPNSLDMQL